jgi:predicted thioesterase
VRCTGACGSTLLLQVEATATVGEVKGKKRIVSVTVKRGDTEMMAGEFVCFVLPTHVLTPKG